MKIKKNNNDSYLLEIDNIDNYLEDDNDDAKFKEAIFHRNLGLLL